MTGSIQNTESMDWQGLGHRPFTLKPFVCRESGSKGVVAGCSLSMGEDEHAFAALWEAVR